MNLKLLVCIALSLLSSPLLSGELSVHFDNPPASARPRTWWHWVSGNVSSEGITADLQAMKDIGLGGCQLFTVDQSDVHGPLNFMSQQWRDNVKQTLAEADKLGLEISIEGCDGWSESGGPWIKPEQGMQHVVWTEKNVTGGGKISLDLPQPPATREFYKDIALLAFPMLKGDDLPLPSALKCSITNMDGVKLIDGNADTGVEIDIVRNSPLVIDLAYERAITCASLTVTGDPNLAKNGGSLESSLDGINFSKVGPIYLGGVSAIPPTTGKFFRLTFPKINAKRLRLSEVYMTGPRMDQLRVLTGMQPKSNIPFTDSQSLADEVIDPMKIIDLTGKSVWEAPTGRWTLIRIGHTGTGATTHPSTKPGLECDKLSRSAVRHHFEEMYGPILKDSPQEAGRAMHSILLDSWECGCGNWTTLMAEEFSERRGYGIKRWLPVFTGRVVKDSDSTQKFLWDFRRVIADMLTENHYGVAQQFAHEHHLKLYAEAPGIGLPTVADNLACKGRTDIPMGEFWVNRTDDDNIDDPKEAASAAHIYGKPVVATESFTATANVASWANDPYSLKRLGDMEFCLGVNRFIFHRYAHQPWNDRQPGMSMGPWGINFERSNTWWKQGSAWMDYLTRCQALLQQGYFVADLLYYYGEGAAARVEHRELKPSVPAGYDYDVCNTEILLNQMSVNHGEIILKSGMHYHALVLPDTDRMTSSVLRKIQSLVSAGAVIYGPKPVKSPSLEDNDNAVQKIAAKVWGDCDGVKVTSHNYGKGRVLWGEPISGALPSMPDFTASEPGMKFIHRLAGDDDIFFVSNQRKLARAVDCTFRVTGKIPEFWHPDLGSREMAALYQTTNGVTKVPIQFDPVGSVFVIFRKSKPSDQAVSISRDGKIQLSPNASQSSVVIQSAIFGVPGDSAKSRDARAEVKQLVASGMDSLNVDDFKKNGDPAFGTLKTLSVEFAFEGHTRTVTAREGEILKLWPDTASKYDAPRLWRQTGGSIGLQTFESGDYKIRLASGNILSGETGRIPSPLTLGGEWQLGFPPKLGAPASAIFDHLMSWTEWANDGVKYFSGTATYRKDVEIPGEYFGTGRKIVLDLGLVKNLAEVTLNGKSLGILWKEPFRVDITDAATVGQNKLEIKVTNLWPNRMIADQKLPKDQRITWASVEPYKADDSLLPSGLIGPVQIRAAQELTLK